MNIQELRKLAREALGDRGDKWLETPMPWLGGQSPITWVGHGKSKSQIVRKLQDIKKYRTS